MSSVDLSEYQQAPGAGILAGSTGEVGSDDQISRGTCSAAAAQVAELKTAVTKAGSSTAQLATDPLGELFTDLLEIGERTERAQAFTLADAIDRGIIDHSDAGSPRQWITDKAPCLEPGQASRIVAAATAINQPRNAPLRGALAAGAITVRALVVTLREHERVRHVLPDATREEVLGYYLAIAHQGQSADLRDLTRRIIAAYGGDKAQADEDQARRQESLSWFELPGGMTRVRADLSSGDAAVFTNAIEALAKPRPGTTSDGDTAPEGARTFDGKSVRTDGIDQRSPGKRRADALMEIVNAAARATESDGGRASVKATITVPLSALLRHA